jgi:hypothetical protein
MLLYRAQIVSASDGGSMDRFKEQSVGRQLSEILLLWASFKSGIYKSIASYKANIPEGQLYGAEVKEPDESSIVIACQRGGDPNAPYSSLLIRIHAQLVSQGIVSIDCKIEKWHQPPVGEASLAWHKSIKFLADEHRTSLICEKNKLAPAEAGASLIETALLDH